MYTSALSSKHLVESEFPQADRLTLHLRRPAASKLLEVPLPEQRLGATVLLVLGTELGPDLLGVVVVRCRVGLLEAVQDRATLKNPLAVGGEDPVVLLSVGQRADGRVWLPHRDIGKANLVACRVRRRVTEVGKRHDEALLLVRKPHEPALGMAEHNDGLDERHRQPGLLILDEPLEDPRFVVVDLDG